MKLYVHQKIIKMKKFFLISALSVILFACGNGNTSTTATSDSVKATDSTTMVLDSTKTVDSIKMNMDSSKMKH